MTTSKPTIGKAIDQVIEAIHSLEKREQLTVISTVCEYLQLGINAIAANRQSPDDKKASSPPETISSLPAKSTLVDIGMDIRSLKEQKQPDSARQMACVVAYYLMEHAPEAERKQAITSADLEKYFKQANFKLPGKLEQVLADSKRSGYFEIVARGEYKLTRVGYNLVTHSMPKASKG